MVDMLLETALSPSARQVRNQQQQQQQQQQQPPQQNSAIKDRVIQASFLIPAYQKALPQALLQQLPDDHRLRKIEATCSCKISWGCLPDGLAERYRLLQLAFDPGSRGNYLGALNLLRMYFLGRTAMMPFQQTLLRPDGKQVTLKFPISVDHCRLLMPRRLDRFGRDADGIVANLAKAAAAAKAARDDECRRLADQIMDSCLRCLAQQVAFTESELARDQHVTQQVNEVEASMNQLVSSVETLAQCEISRSCVRALVEAAEATRLLARLNAPSQASISPPPQKDRSVSPSRRRIDFHLSTATSSSTDTSKKRTNARRAASGSRWRCSGKQQHQCQKQQIAATPTTIQQANNHHRPYAGRIKRPQHQPSRQQHHVYYPHQQHQKLLCQIPAEHPEESCDTTLADVEAFTFADSEYVNAAAAAKKTPSPVVTGVSGTAAKTRTPSNKIFPETLLLCGLQPSAAVALAALDRSDRRLKAIERRTGCRLELRERRCINAEKQHGNEAPANVDAIQQVSYALQVVPLRTDSRPRGCANMLRSLLRRLDPSGRYFFCVVSASELPTTGAATSSKVQQKSQQNRQCYQQPAALRARSKSATKAELKRVSRQQQHEEEQQLQSRHHQENRWDSEPSTESHLPNVLPAVLAAHAVSQIDSSIADCLLGIAASSSATANAATSLTFQRSLEHDREKVLSDALLCVFRSLTANETDARLLDEVMDEADDDGIECADTQEDNNCSSTAGSIGCIREAIRRTLVACADERRLGSLLGAFSICLPQQSEQNEPPLSSLSLSFSTVTQRVRRRLARLTLTCWEQLCHEAMTTSAGGAAALLAGVAFEAAWNAAENELMLERHLAIQQNYASKLSSNRLIANGQSTKEQSHQQVHKHLTQQQQQKQQQQKHRRQRSSRRRSPRNSPATIGDDNNKHRQPANSLEKTIRSLASHLIADQVSCACLRAHLMLRYRLLGV